MDPWFGLIKLDELKLIEYKETLLIWKNTNNNNNKNGAGFSKESGK